MIRGFADKETERIWNGRRSRKLPPAIQDRGLDTLKMLNRAKSLDDLRNPPSNRLHELSGDRVGQHSISINTQWRIMLRLEGWSRDTCRDRRLTTDPDWLHNSHAGELLVREFMEPLGLTTEALADALRIDVERLKAVIDGTAAIDAELDLRLARYFRMSEGFFLGLQDDYELLEAKRALKFDLERIAPRAA